MRQVCCSGQRRRRCTGGESHKKLLNLPEVESGNELNVKTVASHVSRKKKRSKKVAVCGKIPSEEVVFGSLKTERE